MKELSVIAALQLIAGGKTKKEACAEMEISTESFDYAISKNKDLVNEFITVNRKQLTQNYSKIVATRNLITLKILAKIDEDLEDPERLEALSLKELVERERYLKGLQESTELQLNITDSGNPENESAEARLEVPTSLPKPKLVQTLARVTQREMLRVTDFTVSEDNIIDA